MNDFIINNSENIRLEKEIATMSKRAIPIAIQQTLTNTARAAWKHGRENTNREFQLRNTNAMRSQTYQPASGLDVDNMKAVVGSSADYLAQQEQGFTRTSSGKAGVWVPTADAAGQSGQRTKPVLRRNRRDKLKLKRKVRKRASSPAQQRLFNMYNAVMGNKLYWGELNNTVGMWNMTGVVHHGKLILTSVRLLYSANKRSIRTDAHAWHEPSVKHAIDNKMPLEYHKALDRQLKRIRGKQRTT